MQTPPGSRGADLRVLLRCCTVLAAHHGLRFINYGCSFVFSNLNFRDPTAIAVTTNMACRLHLMLGVLLIGKISADDLQPFKVSTTDETGRRPDVGRCFICSLTVAQPSRHSKHPKPNLKIVVIRCAAALSIMWLSVRQRARGSTAKRPAPPHWRDQHIEMQIARV
ncbi:jg22802 [Pararge aegeria aegeria]|uniref:Jg22802 protein n=1 Tax=Pararge aegeria aegeria TaxID=348720 RepID=A0A8S4RUS0_9NEOP|nr:jg22802 [Pararge aegeria aegeria]